MCGIVALHSKDQPVNVSKVMAGLEVLHHRGPDHQAYWRSKNNTVLLGHTRLSIIDLESGNQPISDKSGTYHVVVNGEFYDYERIREELTQKGHAFKTKSDSEIALHLYAEYGASCLKYLRGEFAFCLWDSREQTLFAARDRFGIKPLFYTKHQGQFYLASEIKALLAAGVPAEWDQEAYLSRAFIYGERTLFKNIYKLLPGHYLTINKDGLRSVKYWDFDYPAQSDYSRQSEEQLIDEVKELFLESIRLRLRADVPIGVYLSGGIDSSAVLGVATELHENTVDAFTLSFQHENYNELAIAEETARHVGAHFNPIHITQADLADHFADTIWHCESVCINAHGVAKYLLSKAVRDAGYKVVLTGEGADEVFAGYPPFRQDNMVYNQVQQWELIQQLYDENPVSAGLLLSNESSIKTDSGFLQKKFGLVPTWLVSQLQIIETTAGFYNNNIESGPDPVEPFRQHINNMNIAEQIDGCDPVHVSMYLISKSLLPNYVLTILGDRVEMAHSIEGRTPFLDHLLVEHAVKIPISMKIKGMTEKYIMREAFKPWLTDSVYERQKHPFLAPPSVLNPDEKLYQMTRDIFNSSSAAKQPFFDPKKVLSFMDSVLSQDVSTRVSAEPVIMEILSLFVMQEKYF